MSSAPAGAAPAYPAGFQEHTLLGHLNSPTVMTFAPDGRLFVGEKQGVVKVLDPGASSPKTLLNFTDRVMNNGDRGLLGMTVDSNFATNHYLYLLYAYETTPLTPDSDGPHSSRLTRVTVNSDDTLSGGETVLLGKDEASATCPTPANTSDCIPSEGNSHSIGTVRSAPDGTLWVGSGDASSYSKVDPLAFRTYNEQSFAGKLIHIDRNGQGLAGHRFCPADTDLDHVCTKLHGKGFRNPFRFALRPGGGLFVADVGWTTREEIDLIGSTVADGGHSYGWPCYEGSIHTPGYKDSASPSCAPEYAKEGTAAADVFPKYDYVRGANAAVVGGPTYRGTDYPSSYRDTTFFGDYGSGFLKRMSYDSNGAFAGVTDFATGWSGVDLEEAPNGDLVYVDVGYSNPDGGSVREISYTGGNSSPVAHATGTPTSPGGASVDFSANGSMDPDGDALTYSWNFGDGTPPATGASVSHTYAALGDYTATLTASDGRGRTGTDTVAVSVGNTAPTPSVDAPADGSLYDDGTIVHLSGSATDAEDGPLPATSLSWHVLLHHAGHIHDVGVFTGATPDFDTRDDHDANSYYEIVLTATDSRGLTGSKTISVRPHTVPFHLVSSPAGAPMSYAGRNVLGPLNTSSAVGFATSVAAATSFARDGREYRFQRWSDGGARLHTYRVPPGASTLTAIYRDVTPATSGPAPTKPGRPARPDAVPSVSEVIFDGRYGLLAGRVTGAAGVKRMRVGLGRSAGRHRCRWWSKRRGRLVRTRRSCARPRWIAARIRGDRWTARLRGRPIAGRYRLPFAITERGGHVSERVNAAAGLPRVVVHAAKRRGRTRGRRTLRRAWSLRDSTAWSNAVCPAACASTWPAPGGRARSG